MSRLSKNILYNFAGQGLVIVLGFVAVRYVFHQLGEDALGIIYFALTLSVLLTNVLGMGICETTVREVSIHFASERDYIRDLIRTASLFYWGAYALAGVLIYCATPALVHRWINLKTLDPNTAIQALRILGIASTIAVPRAFYTSMMRGLERMEFNNVVDVATNAFQQFGTIVILLRGGGLLPVVYWLSACFGFGILAYLVVCARFFSWRTLLPGFSICVVRRNVGYTSHMALISLLAMIYMQSDKVVVSKLLPIGLFGLYTIARSAPSRTSLMAGAVLQGAFPHLSTLHGVHDQAGMMSQYRKLHDLVCFATAPLFAAIIFVATPLFTLIFNAATARILFLPVIFLCIGFYMNGTLSMPYGFSLAAGRPDIPARSNFYALFVVLPATVALIYFFGLAGAGFSWVFYHLFAYAYVVPRTCWECLQISAREWYLHVAKILVIAGACYGLAWGFVALGGTYSLTSQALAFTAGSALFCLVSHHFMGKELRAWLSRLLFLWSRKSRALAA